MTCASPSDQSASDSLHFVGVNGTACHPELSYIWHNTSRCPVFVTDAFWQFLDQYFWLPGALLILLGIFLTFFGNRFVSAVIFLLVAFCAFCILGGLFFYLFLEKVKKDWGKWLALAGIVVVSLGLGWLAKKYRKIGIAVFGAWGGVMLGLVITTAFAVGNAWAYYITIIATAIICFLITYKVEAYAVIALTGFVGAYSLIRGISFFAGGFPNEADLRKQFASGAVDWSTFDKRFYIYLGAIIVTTIVGIMFQLKHDKSLRTSLRQLKTPLR